MPASATSKYARLTNPILQSLATLHYFKFKCADIFATIDFYQTLGMQISYKQEMNTKDSVRKFVAFHYPSHPQVSLLFENNEEYAKSYHQAKVASSVKTLMPEYLLIYVTNIGRMCGLLQSKGFKLLLSPTDLSETKIALVNDPNGIQVRLQELSDVQMTSNPAKTKQSGQARIGYYSVPTSNIATTVGLYTSMFSVNKSELDVKRVPGQSILPQKSIMFKSRADFNRMVQSSMASKDVAPPMVQEKEDEWKRMSDLDASLLQRLKLVGNSNGPDPLSMKMNDNLEGFKVVDTEDYILGLSRSLFCWMGGEDRGQATTLCLQEKLDAGDVRPASEVIEDIRRVSPFTGFGMQVKNLDGALERIKSKAKDIKTEDAKVYLQGWGVYQKCKDSMNKLEIEIFSKKSDYEQLARRGDQVLEQIKKDAKPDVGPSNVDKKLVHRKFDYEINLNHLKGTTKFLSADALVAKRTDPEDSVAGEDKRRSKKGEKKKSNDRMYKSSFL